MSSFPYICITSDTHAGASIDTYGEYLDPAYRENFAAWRGAYRNPSKKHIGSKKTKNWIRPSAWRISRATAWSAR
jgi:hypothetical protein